MKLFFRILLLIVLGLQISWSESLSGLSSKYGIIIRNDAGSDFFPSSWVSGNTKAKATSVKDTSAYASELEKLLSPYSKGFLQKYIKEIYLANTISFFDKAKYAYYFEYNAMNIKRLYLSANEKDFSILEKYFQKEIAKMIFKMNPPPKNEWNTTLPSGFHYGKSAIKDLLNIKARDAGDTKLLSLGFVNYRSTFSYKEDFTRFWAYLNSDPAYMTKLAQKYPLIKKKLLVLSTHLHSIDPKMTLDKLLLGNSIEATTPEKLVITKVPSGVIVQDEIYKRSFGGTQRVLFLSKPGYFITKMNTEGIHAIWKLSNKGIQKLKEYDHGSFAVGMVVSHDLKYLITVGLSPNIHIWDLVSGKLLRTIPIAEKLYHVDITINDKTLILSSSGRSDGSHGSMIIYMDFKTGKVIQKTKVAGGDTSYITLINNDKEFYYCSTTDSPYVYIGKWKSSAEPIVLKGLNAGPSIKTSPDGKYIIGISVHFMYAARVVLWDIKTKALLSKLEVERGDDSFMDATVSTDNKYIFILFNKKQEEGKYWEKKCYINVYDRVSGKKIRTTTNYDLEGSSINMSPDGEILMVLGEQRLDKNYGKDQGRILMLNPKKLLK